jgi:glutaconate CoA-transferase subunit B
MLNRLHAGVTLEEVQANTGWAIKVASDLRETPAPTAEHLRVLRDLQERTALAHAG